MRMKHVTMTALLPLLIMGTAARADDIRPAMEAANSQFLAAFNSPNPAAFVSLYTADAVLFFQGSLPVTGPEAIKQFWESRIKLGIRDHTFDIGETGTDGRYAWQISRTTVQWVRDTGEKTLIAGNAVRIFEKQSDGTWKTKIHMWNRPQ
jgi:ketosteroid isomerase-like protein